MLQPLRNPRLVTLKTTQSCSVGIPTVITPMNSMPDPGFEAQLQKLALMAQSHPLKSRERRLALKRLIDHVIRADCLQRPQAGKFSPPLYKEIYAEAVQELFLYVCQKIDKYDASRGTVLVWLNMLLSQRFIKEAIPKILDNTHVSNWALPDLDRFVPPQNSPPLIEELATYIDADPNREFESAHVREHPEVNFQYLMKRRLAGDAWEQISQDVNLSVSTISNFFYRCISRFSAQLRDHCTHY